MRRGNDDDANVDGAADDADDYADEEVTRMVTVRCSASYWSAMMIIDHRVVTVTGPSSATKVRMR